LPHTRECGTSDELQGSNSIVVPHQLTDDRSAATLQSEFAVPQIDPVALKLLQAKLSDGSFLIPSAGIANNGHNVVLTQAATFVADQFNSNIDYNLSSEDRLSGKYFYQRNPNASPFAVSSVEGFAQQLQAGSQVASIGNTNILTPNLTWEQRIGYVRRTSSPT
jgi:hypothetical protein